MSPNASPYLPPEIIDMIAKELALDHPPTLFNLAKANKTFHAICRPFLKSMTFHDVILRIPSWPLEKKLEEPVVRLMKILQDAGALQCVRQLFLCDEGPARCKTGEQWSPPRISDLRCERTDTYKIQYSSWREHPASIEKPVWLDNWLRIPFGFSKWKAWRPAVKLIKMLPGLTDLIWNFPEELPPSILATLHEARPNCRLHIHSFWLHTLLEPEANTNQHLIFTSPSIHTIKLSTSGSTDHILYNGLLRVLEQAPNLKEVHLSGALFADPTFTGRKCLSRLPSLEVFHLDIDRWPWHENMNIAQWSNFIDTSKLKVLRLGARMDYDAFRRWSPRETLFPSLQSLSLTLNNDWTPELYNVAGVFLQYLPPLNELELKNWNKLVSVTSIASRHGSHLRKLKLINERFGQCLEEQEIRQIGGNCPLLQDMAITIRRTQGDAKEVALYKALGTIRGLQYLDLDYELPYVVIDERTQEATSVSAEDGQFDNQILKEDMNWYFHSWPNVRLRNGDVRRILIDSIIDAKLSCNISQTISNTKPPRCPLLQDLVIEIREESSDRRMEFLIQSFGSKWNVKRDFRCMHRDNLIAEEIISKDEANDRHLSEFLEPIFYQLFPAAEPKGPPRKTSKRLGAKRRREKYSAPVTWRRYIHSFPLALGPEYAS